MLSGVTRERRSAERQVAREMGKILIRARSSAG
jgi:hypothetical protein